MVSLIQSVICFAAAHKPQEFLAGIRGQANEGQLIVEHFCADCHSENPLIPIGAPRIKYSADWQVRIKQSMESVMAHVYEGFNAMPPRGGCFECSDEQLMLAVESLLPPSMRPKDWYLTDKKN